MFLFTDHGAQQAIDIEIRRLLVNIQELKHLRNTHSAINKLPIDIMSLILVESKSADFYSEKQTWKGLLGVCRRWRDILLAFPAFWSMINLDNECCPLQEVLQRSGRCPLSVVAPLGGCGEKSFETVLLEVERFKDLSVTFHPMLSHPFDGLSITSTSASASTSTPSLQILTLRAHISHTVTIPNHLPFFGNSLTVLRLQDVTFQPEIPILPSLRKLIAVGYWSRNELTISWITTVLRRTPNIEEARFWGICAGHDDDTPNHPFITLPRLKRINIASQEVSDSSLFRYLSFPKSAIITSLYQNDFEERIYQSSQHFHSLISWLTSDSDAISYEEMRIIRAEDQRESTYFHLELLSLNSQMPEPALCLGLPYDPAAQEVYRRLCTCIPLSHVTQVTFSRFHPLEEEWSEFFSALVNLETLSLEDASDFWLPRFLSSPTVATALKVIVYKLTSLPISEDSVCCMDIHIAEELDAVLDHRTPSKGNHDLSRLQFLKQRRDAGIPLQKLIINQCYISRRYIDLLRLYVDVDWDGIQDVDDMDDGCLRPFSLFSEKFSYSISAFDQRVE